MGTRLLRTITAVAFFIMPISAYAAGGHDGLSCTGCHSLHNAKADSILAVQPNTKELNPRTKQPYGGTTGICLGCHQSPEKGGNGMTPISAHVSHPYGLSSINPKIAHVPNELLSNGRFECTSCHDPHPSNTNRKYLRMDAGGSAPMENFCAVCHPAKSDPKIASAKSQANEQQKSGENAASGKKK